MADGASAVTEPLHVLFWHPPHIAPRRPAPLTLEDMYDVGGFSGTETSLLEMAGHLVEMGHRATVCSAGYPPSTNGEPDSARVHYRNHDAVSMPADVTHVCPMFYHDHPQALDVLRQVTQARAAQGATPPVLLVWLHSFVSPSALSLLLHLHLHLNASQTQGQTQTQPPEVPVHVVGVSAFVEAHMAGWTSQHGIPYTTIENGLSPEVFGPVPSHDLHARQPRSFVFHPVFDRGGLVAQHVHARVAARSGCGGGGGDFHSASYNMSDGAPPPSPSPHGRGSACFDSSDSSDIHTVFHGSLSKRALAALMWRVSYFVYPLVSHAPWDHARVHHDTYACSVLEALACGVLVVTWDVACFRDVYRKPGDECWALTLVPPPACPGYDPQAQESSNERMLTHEAADTLADVVMAIEALEPARRDEMRAQGRAWALRQTWASRARQLALSLRGK